MTKEKLEKSKKLIEIITVTEHAIAKLQMRSINNSSEEYNGMYNYYVGEYSDGSGISAGLCRYLGNARLHQVILNELKKQLEEFQSEFEAI